MAPNHPLIFGEVLYDCFPDGVEVPGGAPFNVAWNLQALGQQPVFISRVGNDPRGGQITELMRSWSMDAGRIQVDSRKPTGKVEISLLDGEPGFFILPDQAYDYISPENAAPEGAPALLYHGSLALRNVINRKTLAAIRRDFPCPVFLDINLRDPWWERDDVMSMIKGATWLKLNDEECFKLFPNENDPAECARMLLDRGYLEAVFLTLGENGAKAFTRDNQRFSVKPSGRVKVVDAVGTGDAFSAVLLLGILNQWPLQLTMERAQEFAASVVGWRGAISLDRKRYDAILEGWRD